MLALRLAIRYSFSKYKFRFLSFSACVAIIGIALGIMSLIITSAIMNGLQFEVSKKLHDVSDQITLTKLSDKPISWSTVIHEINSNKDVISVTPAYETYALLEHGDKILPVLVKGIDPKQESSANPFLANLPLTQWLKPNQFNFVGTRNMLGFDQNSQYNLIVPKFKTKLITKEPISHNIKPKGLIEKTYGVSNQVIYMNINDIMKLMQVSQPTSLKVKTSFPSDSLPLSQQLANHYSKLNVMDWSQSHRLWLENLVMQKRVFSIFLCLLVVVALFSLVANLSMLVTEKRSEIAMMKTMGASNSFIIRVFIYKGLILSTLGMLLGVSMGYWIVSHMNSISSQIELIFGIKFFSPTLWPIDFVPTKLVWSELYTMLTLNVFSTIIFAYFPARRAANIMPAKALSYEA